MYYARLIEKFQKQPKWQGPQFDKGIYALRLPLADIKVSLFSTNANYIHGEFAPFNQFTTHLTRCTKTWIEAMREGNITFDDPYVTIIGHFEKQGTKFYFIPETEVHYDSPY